MKSKLNVESKGNLRKVVIDGGDMEVCTFIKVPSSVEVTVAGLSCVSLLIIDD